MTVKVSPSKTPGSILDEDRLLVPIRMVESLAYCPRQAWYRFTLGDDPLNLAMERGLRRHATFAEAEPPERDGLVCRHLPVFAPVIGVQGVLDEVVIEPTSVTITEYKSARLPKAAWEGVELQLAVQALALVEHAAGPRWLGQPLPADIRLEVFYTESWRRQTVPWTPALADRARAVIAASRAVLLRPSPPPGLVGPRCHRCQLEPTCLPFDLHAWRAAADRNPAPTEESSGR